jgi:hypothetical protein
MQFHLNGFRPGDPDLAAAPPAGAAPSPQDLPEEVDVLIVGAGSAGLTLAAQMAAFPDITTRLVERRAGPMEKGQADGVSCRSMEMFQAFGFAGKVMREAYWVNEATFWTPGACGGIVRNGRVQDVEDGLSEMPHVILNQARVHDMYLDVMRRAPSRMEPDYGLEMTGLTLADESATDHPVTVVLAPADGTAPRIVRAPCDSRSPMLRFTPKGADIDAVIDVRAVYPDHHHDLEASDLPALLTPRKGRHGLTDHEKVFCADHRPGHDIYELRGIDRSRGCIVVVRPDQYVAQVFPMEDHSGLAAYFDRFLRPQAGA